MKEYFALRKFYLPILLLFLIFLFSSCSSSIETTSTYNNNQIVIDGSYQDWGTSLNYVKDDNIAFGFKNDKDNLYIAIVTSDMGKIMKILTGGLTVWIASDRDKIGIEFPLKLDPGEMQEIRMRQPDKEDPFNFGDRIKGLILKNNQMQIVSSDNQLILTENANLGPDFIGKIGYNANQFVYELKIPIVNSEAAEKVFYKNINKVKITFETGEITRDKESMHANRMNDDDEMQPNQEGRTRGMGNRQPRERMDSSPLDYTFDVVLSK